ncbi:hypothetical protein RFI_16895 [Reticulomyxa filosa]|uniref:Mitochondrial carrier protein n=1 Tax=Reticulomyxa filosa TaxID=46433 RepID=X6N4S6_RETFI|nr:hypothetical protein RFI_16895 [Reticulomyxa filosa]|eukprot:ETO20322.1 hypothetical protein RFI_16895 [Reticulomyxa filosa]
MRASIQKGSLFALNDFGQKQFHQSNLSLSTGSINFISGSLAGVISTFTTHPLDIVKTANQAIVHSTSQARFQAIPIWYGLTLSKGIFGPWITLVPTLAGTALYYGIKFAGFDLYMNYLNKLAQTFDLESKTESGVYLQAQRGTAGMLAGLSGNFVCFPNNCVRKYLSTTNVLYAFHLRTEPPLKYFGAVKYLYKTYGLKRFYNGFGVNLLRNAPNTGIQFMVFLSLKDYYQGYQLKI